MSARKLRVVGPDDVPDSPMSVSEASASGDRLLELTAMRQRIAAALDSPKTLARDLASLSRRLMEIGKEIEDLEERIAEKGLDGVNVEDEAWTAI